MKRLIFTQDVEKAKENRESTIYIDGNTIITPLAKDLAQNYGISFLEREQSSCQLEKLGRLGKLTQGRGEQMDMDLIYKVFNLMKEKGLLEDILNWISEKPYVFEGELGGFKVIRGTSIKTSTYDTHNPQDKVYYQQLIERKEAGLTAGILHMEASELKRKLTYNKIAYVIEGSVNIQVVGRSITAYKGDIVHIPEGSHVLVDSQGSSKLFYVRYMTHGREA